MEERPFMVRWVVGSILRRGSIKIFIAVLMYYRVGEMMHIKDPLLPIGKGSP